MIDWYGLFYNAAWVLGLAVVLAAFAMASYQTRAQGVRLRQALRASGFLLPFGVGTFLFCLGVLFTSHTWWEKGIWGVCAILLIVWAVRAWRRRGAARDEGV